MDETDRYKSRCHPGGRNFSHRKRPSSFWMQDPNIIFKELDLRQGDVFLDLGCGTGDYSICAAEEVGESGLVYATDIQEELISALAENAGVAGLKNIKPLVADIHDPLPFENNTIDVCFISTVLHSVNLEDTSEVLFSEINRILKPKGRLFIVECKKERMDFGPPLSMRLSPDEIEGYVSPYGLEKNGITDLGYNYMIRFTKSGI